MRSSPKQLFSPTEIEYLLENAYALIHLQLKQKRKLAMFFTLSLLCAVHLLISICATDDLSISKYSQVGCLTLKADKEFIAQATEENHLLPFQTYSSPNMTVELCFLLCRRWLILLHDNRTKCICLYTLNKPYELQEYLGEYSTDSICSVNAVEVYSLTKEIASLPLLSSSPRDDWSLDGCYELEGIQNPHLSARFSDADFPTAIELCRKHCLTTRRSNYYSYFLSRLKSCYCLPIQLRQMVRSMALRKPLRHCSFLPSICQAFGSSCRRYYSDTSMDTLIKIDVHRYCLSTDSSSFVFDRTFYACLKSFVFRRTMSIATISYDQKCLPIQIRTRAQWNYLTHSSWVTNTNLFVPIDRNSTYIVKDLFASNDSISTSGALCVIMKRMDSTAIKAELISCSLARAPANVLCAQKPLRSAIPHDEEFRNTNAKPDVLTNETLSCPANFILLNKVCYSAGSSLAYDVQTGERLCQARHPNSTLVRFESHDWGNINITRFLGRIFNDILLELVHYVLEKRLIITPDNEPDGKEQWRLLLGENMYLDKCVLRHFSRSTGGFVLTQGCTIGGYPVCQSESIRTRIPETVPSNTTIDTADNSSAQFTIELNSTTSFIIVNESITQTCENCTTSLPIADEDLINNETKTDLNNSSNSSVETSAAHLATKHTKHRPLILILSGPILSLIILFVAIGLLVWHLRGNHGSYTPRNSIVGGSRTKRSSTVVTASDVPIKPPRHALNETDLLLTTNHFPGDDDQIELLPTTKMQAIDRIDEESLYANPK